ncbi:Alpha/beta hydrolase [Rhodovastum atsumiense]|uniref:Alpha/beta hydrolase n=1 Tax=Rhodovastum atsumiense TaxID=504468 RepID=A0A5M6IQ48_9PROT|nr:alpha/beta hydrolase [Rhodovastum atsumiense]KAA5610037.1 alpha/beta hydrolase [Rhodovastum atsumiense]CAH2602972.1 Alpha/beta hydrolase [Rhodovastum atsumiense]
MPDAVRARAIALSLMLATALAAPLAAQEAASGWNEFALIQSGANSRPGPRQLPARSIPVPQAGVSPGQQAVIAAPYPPGWNAAPRTVAEWQDLVVRNAAPTLAALPGLREQLGVTSEPVTIAGVKAFVVQPRVLPAVNRDRVLLHLHGGGYVFGPGEAGTREAVLLAAHGGFKVVSVDYRMPPEAPYPAALDDSVAVYRDLLKTTSARRIGVFGTSTGGGLTLALVLRAKAEGLPLPAAIAPGTPWSDLTETGDSYFVNEFADNLLVSWKGWLGHAAALYANGHDLRDPYLSPVYGDFTGFPPAILTSGTRDLFLSNTVRVHRKLRQAGVEADLHVFEGQSHAQYYADPSAPETIEYHAEVARFLDAHLAR